MAVDGEGVKGRGRRPLTRSRARRGASGFQVVAGLFVVLVLACAILAPLLASADPNQINLANRLQPPVFQSGGDWGHVFGTDELGRDVLSRIIYGARTSMLVGTVVVLLTMVVGIVLGVTSGYVGGRFDAVLRWIVDVCISLPGLLLSAVIVFVFGASIVTVIIALSVRGWLVYYRLARSMTLSMRTTPYIEAARTVGTSEGRLLWKHVVPNILSPLVTLATLEFAQVVLAEAALSFLGLGIQPPLVSWGLMINGGGAYITVAWWLIAIPGAVLTLTVLCVNLLSDWLRLLSDPLQRVGAER